MYCLAAEPASATKEGARNDAAINVTSAVVGAIAGQLIPLPGAGRLVGKFWKEIIMTASL
jgi:hypothetical protein